MRMDARNEVITRLLPKTGQTNEFATNDDGTYQAGWWKGKTVANNRNRFIAKTIGGDAVVIDLATGLMWPTVGTAAGCNNNTGISWDAAIIYAEGLDFAGFSDWRLPNLNELASILNYANYDPAIDTNFFTATSASEYWTTTSSPNDPQHAYSVHFGVVVIEPRLKFGAKKLRCVRLGV